MSTYEQSGGEQTAIFLPTEVRDSIAMRAAAWCLGLAMEYGAALQGFFSQVRHDDPHLSREA
ncbi:MAG TPA: hypothetical protein VLF91_01335 [Candidatus Saccharimonadales bacterium]|nr:hypothetical protein [Candidatus Saccharimonadales bacterium]